MKNKRSSLFLGLFLFLIQALPIAGFFLDYFTRKRLGMLRHMVYLNAKWEAQYPIEILKWGAIFFLILYTLVLVYAYTRTRRAVLLWNVLVSASVLTFLLVATKEWSRAYYGISLCLLLYLLMTGLWTALYLKFRRNMNPMKA